LQFVSRTAAVGAIPSSRLRQLRPVLRPFTNSQEAEVAARSSYR
jgi:hypothetical protein